MIQLIEHRDELFDGVERAREVARYRTDLFLRTITPSPEPEPEEPLPPEPEPGEPNPNPQKLKLSGAALPVFAPY